MTNTLEILNPVRRVTVDGAPIEVHELRALEAYEFFNRFQALFARLANKEGAIQINVVTLAAVITQSEELTTWLILRTTRRDRAWLETVSLTGAFDVIDAALEINMSVIKKNVGRLGGRVQLIFGARTPDAPLPPA